MTAPVQTDDNQGWTPWWLRRRQAGPMWGVSLSSILSIVYFWLRWVFIAAQASSSCSEWGITPRCGVQACLAVEHRLNSCGTQALLLQGMRDLPGPRIEPMFPALAGGFLTTGPPGKSSSFTLNLCVFIFKVSLDKVCLSRDFLIYSDNLCLLIGAFRSLMS